MLAVGLNMEIEDFKLLFSKVHEVKMIKVYLIFRSDNGCEPIVCDSFLSMKSASDTVYELEKIYTNNTRFYIQPIIATP